MGLKKEMGDKVIVIIGGARGIGKGMAKCFKAVGSTVIIGDINEKLGKKTAKGGKK